MPTAGKPTRSEYFVKGTEPTSESQIYKVKDGRVYFYYHEDDPVSTDGINRWQQGIDAWIEQFHKDDPLYHPPGEVVNPPSESTNSDNKDNNSQSSTPTITPTPTP